jgi:hypothetical protein
MSLIQREKRVGLHLPVEVQGEDALGVPFSETTRSLNVSGGGICFESRRQIAVGERLQLAIVLPPALRRHFGNVDVYRARAVVCRVERAAAEPGIRVGARFLAEGPP